MYEQEMHIFHSNSIDELHIKIICHCCKVNGAVNFHWTWADFDNSLSSSFSQATCICHSRVGSD